MVAQLTVLYPNEPDAKYDIEYYKTQHMPLMERLMGKHGVINWTVATYLPGPDGSAPPYVFSSTANWTSAEAIKKSFEDPATAQVLADIPNFSNKQPILIVGEVSSPPA